MSRIRTTLDSVTKAVGSTDLISKFSRLKPGGATVDSTHAGKALAKNETLASNNAATAPPPETTMKEEEGESGTEEKESANQCQQEKPFVAAKKSTSSLAATVNASVPSTSSTVAKQTMQLFHPAALSTDMDETYKTLAEHINSHFGTSTQVEEVHNMQMQQHRGPEPVLSTVHQTGLDHIPVLSPVSEAKIIEAPTTSAPPPPGSENPSAPGGKPTSNIPASKSASQSIPAPPTSPRKGFTHYLSYPRPSVQAFVGSYIAPLVPKFRGEAKSISAEKDKSAAVAVKEPTVDKAVEKTESEEEKVKQQLLSQQEKVRCGFTVFSLIVLGESTDILSIK